ncbi:MAG: serine hydrolase [Bacteroidia bacterium]|nr:serine hydrolase [Bacteroidia bacterium]
MTYRINSNMKSFIALCAFALLCQPSFAGNAGDPENDDSTKTANIATLFAIHPDTNILLNENLVRAGLLYDMDQKKIVWEKKMDVAFPIASLTKMMVALLTVEDIRAGKISWDNKVSVTKYQVGYVKGKKQTVAVKEIYSLEDLFKAAMIASDNAASEAIAGFIGGSVSSFVDRMNVRAVELGMSSTVYSNPTGLPAHPSSYDNKAACSDLLLLALEMMQYDEIIGTTSQGYADINNGRTTSTVRNHNHLVIDFENEVDGLKTGYTRRAGFCLVATAKKCEHRLIAIALGSNSPTLRNDFVKKMFDGYYSSIGLDKLGNASESKSVNASIKESYLTKTRNYLYHIVKRGETLVDIADLYPGISVKDILRINRISYQKILRSGIKIRIPLKA